MLCINSPCPRWCSSWWYQEWRGGRFLILAVQGSTIHAILNGYPLTITDRHSRYLLACEVLESVKENGAFPEVFPPHVGGGVPSLAVVGCKVIRAKAE